MSYIGNDGIKCGFQNMRFRVVERLNVKKIR